MSSRVFDGLDPRLQPAADWLLTQAPEAQVTSVRRSWWEQYKLYRRFLAGRSSFPAKPPGTSYHEYGRAFDMVAPERTLRRLGALWQRMGGRWGGESDPIHFEA